MKLIICQSSFDSNNPANPVIFLKPDTALLRNNNAFFIPDFSFEIEYELHLVIKVGKMGKCISKNFAHRYYHEFGVAVNFTAKDVFQRCIAQNIPTDLAYAFDNSSAISPLFLKKEDLSSYFSIGMQVNNQWVQKTNFNNLALSVDEAIAYISRFFTIKIGDYIFLDIPKTKGIIKKDDRFQGYIDDQLLLDFNIQ